jgi:hypothetical protein
MEKIMVSELRGIMLGIMVRGRMGHDLAVFECGRLLFLGKCSLPSTSCIQNTTDTARTHINLSDDDRYESYGERNRPQRNLPFPT